MIAKQQNHDEEKQVYLTMPPRGGKTTKEGAIRAIAFVEDCVTLEAPKAKQDDL